MRDLSRTPLRTPERATRETSCDRRSVRDSALLCGCSHSFERLPVGRAGAAQSVTVMLSGGLSDYRNVTSCDARRFRGLTGFLITWWCTRARFGRVRPSARHRQAVFCCFSRPDTAIHSLSMPRTRKLALASAHVCAMAHSCADVATALVRLRRRRSCGGGTGAPWPPQRRPHAAGTLRAKSSGRCAGTTAGRVPLISREHDDSSPGGPCGRPRPRCARGSTLWGAAVRRPSRQKLLVT